MKKKILAALLAMVLVVSSLGGMKISAETSLNEENMERVLLVVKEKLDVEDYENFTYNYYDYSNDATWSFSWSNGNDYSDYLNVETDNQGHIRNYSNNKNENNQGVPAYTAEELLDSAKNWIAKTEPEIADSLELTADSYYYYNNSYNYVFTRVNDGIRMPENSVSISLSAKDGNIFSYRENWNYDVKLPVAAKLISKEEAAAKIGTRVDMELQYFRTWNEEGEAEAFLAYVPSRSYVAVNAKTGKLYTKKYYLNGEWDGAADEADMAAGVAENGVMAKTASISPAERQKIEEIKEIISADEAKQLILDNPYLYREEADYAASSYLYADDDEYYWNISLNDNTPYDYENPDASWYRSYISATVNAKTGEIISYYASVKDRWDYTAEELAQIKVNYTKKQCRENFESFVKQYNPERFKETSLTDTGRCISINYDEVTGKTDYAGYTFNYNRMHENIPFNANSIYGQVEAVTGKVFNYSTNWDKDIVFPSSKDVIGEKKAFEAYMGYEGYDLVYELVTVYGDKYSDTTTKARLVYRTAITNAYVDAKTGKQLNYRGEEYNRKAENYEYTDIEGSKYERTIRLLADMGIGLETTEFRPDEAATAENFDKLLSAASNISYSYYAVDSSESDNAASGTKNGKATREYAAEKLIEALGCGELAKLDIYKTGFDDEADITNVGAVALAKGLGLMSAAKGNSFKPSASVTNGEAAELILNFLEKNHNL